MNMNFGKKISLSQKIGTEGETEVKLWLSKSCHITANKLENDFGIDFVGQWHGDVADKPNTWWVSPQPISIAVRATTNEKGKIRIDKADAKVLLDNPCIFLVIPHFEIEPHKIYAKFIDRQFIDELNLFIDGNKKQKTISIKNCLSDIEDINKQISLLLSPAYAKKIEMHKIKIGLLKISSTGQITINHRDGDSYAFIETDNFNEFFSETDAKLRHDAIWGGLKYHKKYMSKFNSSRKFKRQFVDYLHSLPVTKAILLGNDEMYKERGTFTCSINSSLGKASCQFQLRVSEGWVGLWHPAGFSIKASESKELADGTNVHDIESYLDKNITIADIAEHKPLWDFLLLCRDEDAELIWGNDLKIPIRILPDFYNTGVSLFLYEQMKKIKENLFPSSTMLSNITDEDLRAFSLLHVLEKSNGIGEFEFNLSQESVTKIPVNNISLPLCCNVFGHGIICWQKRKGFLLQNQDQFYVGVHLTSFHGYNLEIREEPFKESIFPFIVIAKKWPAVIISEDGHSKLQTITIPDEICMKFAPKSI